MERYGQAERAGSQHSHRWSRKRVSRSFPSVSTERYILVPLLTLSRGYVFPALSTSWKLEGNPLILSFSTDLETKPGTLPTLSLPPVQTLSWYTLSEWSNKCSNNDGRPTLTLHLL